MAQQEKDKMADDQAQAGQAPGAGTAVAVREVREVRVVHADIPVFDTAAFEHMGRIASVMAQASLTPESLVGGKVGLPGFNPDVAKSNCFQVVELAYRLGYSPFAVAQCASVVKGKLMLEGKFVAAALDTLLNVELHHYFKGDYGTDDFRIYVTDTELTQEQYDALEPKKPPLNVRMIDGSVKEWRTNNENWKSQPDQQLVYRGTRTWARRYKPGVMLGIIADDEVGEVESYSDARESGRGRKRDLAAKLQAPTPEQPQDGFTEGHIERETNGAKEPAQDIAEGHAKADEVYFLDGDVAGEDGRRQTYKNGEKFSRVTPRGTVQVYGQHPPKGEPVQDAQFENAAPSIRSEPEDRREPEGEPQAGQTTTMLKSQPSSDDSPDELDAFDAYRQALPALNSRKEVKQAFVDLIKTSAWKEAESFEQTALRRDTWILGFGRLTKEGIEPVDPGADATVFLCWIYATNAADEIEGTYDIVLTRSEAFKKLSPEQQDRLRAAKDERLKALRAS